ncbi:MAG TPA: serine hydrolase domain-containing protein [Anaerolineales bacterium]|nr:serine hydrolase domain-containing protein [Anaerolineales bacterium]HLO31192.1 serine hydrolase domain-containing protein [Anaerolineales bacterium]
MTKWSSKWQTSLLITFGIFVLLIGGWLGYITVLTKERNRACRVSTLDNQGDNSSSTRMRLQDVLNEYSTQKGGVGLQVTVMFPDGQTWNGVAGYADMAHPCPLTLDHHLYLGSITKLFTATLVMKEVDNGSLFLDQKTNQWIQVSSAENITIRNLLSHTSGLPDYAQDTWFQIGWFGKPNKTWQPNELIRIMQDKPLRFSPGSRHEYSNSNYLLLGVILEKATGKPYSAILQENVLAKLNLHDTFFLNYPDDMAIANGYDETLLHLGRRNLSGFRRSLESGAYAAGGILSTSQDVARFAHALFNGQVLSDTSLLQMETFVETADADIPEQTGYGLGIRHLVIDDQSLVGHTGSIPGYSGIVMHQVEKNYTIAVLSNLSTIGQTRLLAEIQRIIVVPGSR